MIIANPIYDVVFKRMMENEKVAKFFIGTLLDQNIEAIEVKPQEYTFNETIDYSDPKVLNAIENRMIERLSIRLYRLDYVATIKTETGELKKILVEIQKANNQVDVMRFRNYLAEQYKKEDEIKGEKTILPITTIYILGFKIPEIPSACLKVERNYKDLVNNTKIKTKSDFIEKLTHDSYIVQVERITNKYQTKLDKLLSLFEQANFTDDRKIVKDFNHEIDSEDIKLTTDILHYSGTDTMERKKLETEQEAWRSIDALTGDMRVKILKQYQELAEKDKTIDEKDKTIDEKELELAEMKLKMAALMKQLEDKK
jgi:hypothetical protein